MTTGWVCLMYHAVKSAEPGASSDDYFAVSRETFGRHLDAIARSGRRGCTLGEAVREGASGRVAITFDDGTIDHYENALPELVARGMSATFFVITTRVGEPGYVGWAQLREMRRAGMEIGSHTRTHPFLSELDAAGVEREAGLSRTEINAALGQDTTAIALPGGDPPRRPLRPLLGAAGYRIVATSRWGRNREPQGDRTAWIRRSTVRGAADQREFLRILEGETALALRRGIRETALGSLRRLLGPTRYARWRRDFLEAWRR